MFLIDWIADMFGYVPRTHLVKVVEERDEARKLVRTTKTLLQTVVDVTPDQTGNWPPRKAPEPKE